MGDWKGLGSVVEGTQTASVSMIVGEDGVGLGGAWTQARGVEFIGRGELIGIALLKTGTGARLVSGGHQLVSR